MGSETRNGGYDSTGRWRSEAWHMDGSANDEGWHYRYCNYCGSETEHARGGGCVSATWRDVEARDGAIRTVTVEAATTNRPFAERASPPSIAAVAGREYVVTTELRVAGKAGEQWIPCPYFALRWGGGEAGRHILAGAYSRETRISILDGV